MQKSNKLFISMVLISIFPVIGSWFLYHYREHFHWQTLNHGVFIKPPVSASFLYSTLPMQARKWQVIYVASMPCSAACQHMQHQLQQVKKALGNNGDRIQVQMIDSKQITAVFAQHSIKNFSPSSRIYLMDPIGNLFMYYPATIDPVFILQDLKRVLEVSQIG